MNYHRANFYPSSLRTRSCSPLLRKTFDSCDAALNRAKHCAAIITKTLRVLSLTLSLRRRRTVYPFGKWLFRAKTMCVYMGIPRRVVVGSACEWKKNARLVTFIKFNYVVRSACVYSVHSTVVFRPKDFSLSLFSIQIRTIVNMRTIPLLITSNGLFSCWGKSGRLQMFKIPI